MSNSTFSVGWNDLDELVSALRRANPRVDPRALDDAELRRLAAELDGFDPAKGEPDLADLEALRGMWHWGV